MALDGSVQDVAHQGRFAATAYAGHTRHDVQRYFHVNALQIVLPGTFYLDVVVPRAAGGGHVNVFPAHQVVKRMADSRLHVLCGFPLWLSLVDDVASEAACVFSYINNVVGGSHDFLVVFYDDNGVSKFL